MRRAVVSATVVLAVITLCSPVPNTNAASERGPRNPLAGVVDPQTTPVGPICFSTLPFPDVFVWFLDRHGNTANAFHFDGVGRDLSGNRTLVVFDTGDEVTVQAGDEGIRFLLVSGKPIEEPVAWHGPIVMNTREELMQAMKDLQNGTFIKAAH